MIYKNNKIILEISKFLLKIARECHLMSHFFLPSCASFSSTFTEDVCITSHKDSGICWEIYIDSDNH